MFKNTHKNTSNPLIWFIVCLTIVIIAYSPIGPTVIGIWENAEVTIRFGGKTPIKKTDRVTHER